MTGVGRPDSTLDGALDAALARALTAPQVTSAFRVRVQHALSRERDSDLLQLRSQLEREREERLAQIDSQYLSLRRRTLGTLIGAAFAAGAAVAISFPWLQAHLGTWAPFALASAGALAGLLAAADRLRTASAAD